MKFEAAFNDEHFSATTEKYLREMFRPSLAEGVDILADRVIHNLERAAWTAFREPTFFTEHAFARTYADPSAIVYVKDEDVRYYELAVFGGVAHDVLAPARDAEIDERGGFRPGYLRRSRAIPTRLGSLRARRATYSW